jgi:hypothetical protein
MTNWGEVGLQQSNESAALSWILGLLAIVSLCLTGVFWHCIPLPLILGIWACIEGRKAFKQMSSGEFDPEDWQKAETGCGLGFVAIAATVIVIACWGGLLAIFVREFYRP